MRRKKNFGLLGLSLVTLGLLAYLVLNSDPNKNLLLLNIPLPALPVLLILLFIFIFSLFSFLGNRRRGLMVGFFVDLYLTLRLNHLTHPFFLILIIAIFITLELLFEKRK